MGNTSGGLTATDVSLANHLDPYYWYKTTDNTVKNLAGGSIGPAFNRLLHEYVKNPAPSNKDKDIKTSGISYPEEDEDTYQDNAPPAAKKSKGDQSPGLGGAGVAGAALAGAAAAGGHRDPPPPPPPQEHDDARPGTSTGLGQSRTDTVTETETTEEPEMDDGGGHSGAGGHAPIQRQHAPHIDITTGEGNTLICRITINRKIVFESDKDPTHRYHIKKVNVHTKHPLIKQTQEAQNKQYTEWEINLVDSGWKAIDFNSWSNWLDYRLYNFMMNDTKRMRVDTFRCKFKDIFVRDVNKDVNQKTIYEMTEDGRLLVLVDYLNHVPYYSSTGFAPFGTSPHVAFTPWDFWYPIFSEDKMKSPIYYFEYGPYEEMQGPEGTEIFYSFQNAHWKDFRLFRNPLFYRGHRWFLAAESKEQVYKGFNLGPEIGIEGANWNSTQAAARDNHPSIVDYTNNKGGDYIGSQVTGAKDKTPIQGPNDYYNFSREQNEGQDFYQYNSDKKSFLIGKSKGYFHDGWGQRTQQFIHDTDATAGARGSSNYQSVDEELVNWKLPNEGIGTTGLTFVMNGPIWHLPHEGVSFPRGLGACSPLPEGVPQIFVRIKDQYVSENSWRNQMVNFDIEAELTLILERKDSFNPLIFNQIPDEYTTVPGGIDWNHQVKSATTGTPSTPLEFWSQSKESEKVFQGNIFYDQ